jgi:hypothetical protein
MGAIGIILIQLRVERRSQAFQLAAYSLAVIGTLALLFVSVSYLDFLPREFDNVCCGLFFGFAAVATIMRLVSVWRAVRDSRDKSDPFDNPGDARLGPTPE